MVALPVYHICLICMAIGSAVRGGLPHHGSVLANVKHVWYYVHTLAIKSRLQGVCTKFAMLIQYKHNSLRLIIERRLLFAGFRTA